LQSWFPFDIQIYVNGREWLARQLDQRGIRYDRYDNKLTHTEATAKHLAKRLEQLGYSVSLQQPTLCAAG